MERGQKKIDVAHLFRDIVADLRLGGVHFDDHARVTAAGGRKCERRDRNIRSRIGAYPASSGGIACETFTYLTPEYRARTSRVFASCSARIARSTRHPTGPRSRKFA